MDSENNLVNYNRMMQILPMIVGEDAKGIPFKCYGKFFSDFDEDNENPITFAQKIEDQNLPKFAAEEYLLKKFEVSQFPDSGLSDNLIDHIKAEFDKVKKES